MNLAIKRAKVYLRVSIVAAVVGAFGLILFKNRSNEVTVWFFGLTDTSKPINVVWLILSTVAATRAAIWVLSVGKGLWSDVLELRRQKAAELEAEKQRQRVAQLEEREKRLTEKVDRAIDGARPSEDVKTE